MATWDIRSRKRPFELSLPASFSLPGGTKAIDPGGVSFSSTRENSGVWAAIIREGLQWLHEWPTKDLFRHDTTSWMDLVHQPDAHTRGPSSGYPLIVMVKP